MTKYNLRIDLLKKKPNKKPKKEKKTPNNKKTTLINQSKQKQKQNRESWLWLEMHSITSDTIFWRPGQQRAFPDTFPPQVAEPQCQVPAFLGADGIFPSLMDLTTG